MFRTPDLLAQNRRLETEIEGLQTQLARAREEVKCAKAQRPETVDVWVMGTLSYVSLAIAWATRKEEFMYVTAAAFISLVVNGCAKLYAQYVVTLSQGTNPDPSQPKAESQKRTTPKPEANRVLHPMAEGESRKKSVGSRNALKTRYTPKKTPESHHFYTVDVDTSSLTVVQHQQLIAFARGRTTHVEVPSAQSVPHGAIVSIQAFADSAHAIGRVVSWRTKPNCKGTWWIRLERSTLLEPAGHLPLRHHLLDR